MGDDYGTKFYVRSIGKSFFRYFAYIVRRINIYYYYMKKSLMQKKFHIFFLLLIISPLFFIRDIIFGEPIYKIVDF